GVPALGGPRGGCPPPPRSGGPPKPQSGRWPAGNGGARQVEVPLAPWFESPGYSGARVVRGRRQRLLAAASWRPWLGALTLHAGVADPATFSERSLHAPGFCQAS